MRTLASHPHNHINQTTHFSTPRPLACPFTHRQTPQNTANPTISDRARLLKRILPLCSATATDASPSSAAPALTYTSYEGNSWRCELAVSGVKFLVDPWLVSTLTFGSLDRVYCGTKKVVKPETINLERLVAETDFVLLTMGIDDHSHKPTLKRLAQINNSLPIVGSPSAAAVARSLGFTAVTAVDHGQEVTVCGGKIRVRATQGALVGPPWSKRENGFVVSEAVQGGVRLYYEPHADYVVTSVAEVGSVDVVVSPPSTQSLLGYELVKGATANVPLLKLLKPKVVIPLMNAEFDATGPLNDLLSESGGPEALKRQLAGDPQCASMKVQLPKAGIPMTVVL